ncbi:MAG: M3 family metallopeptidase [Bdellovibrionales bacterium]|nr:M3 family metallopeptidase [Bdellovibrionales bacterium]
MNDLKNNPLVNPPKLKNNATPFDVIQNEHFLPAIQEALKVSREEIKKIVESTEKPSFENTIEALEVSSESLDLPTTVFYNLMSSHTNDTLQELAKEIGPLLSEFSNDITLNEALFQKVKTVYDTVDQKKLNQEQKVLLKNTYEDFTRNGALLNEEQKNSLRKIDQELASIAPIFSENVLKATNSYQLEITNADDLKGIPESSIEAAKREAKKFNKENTWIFNLQGPSYTAFMTYAPNRELREQMWQAMASKCYKDDFDNSEVMLKIVRLRFQRAQLLGFKNHADFVLQKRMAKSSDKVMTFLNQLLNKTLPAAQKELEELTAFARDLDALDELKPWDVGYYIEKLKKEKFSFDDEVLRPYFKLENVIDGVFKHAEILYDLSFQPSKDYPVYHKDVQVFEVYNKSTKSFVGLFYADFFPRDSKRSGAWMTNFKEQGLQKGHVERPHIGIVCNFTPSSPTTPSLLTFNEVRTLFHEFGHALHGLLSQCHYKSLSGANVHWDFVELPSQIFENWTLEEESLNLFAKHYQSGENIPQELILKIKEANQFMSGYYSSRQLSFGFLDMAWHAVDPTNFKDVEKVEIEATDRMRLMPKQPNAVMSVSFSHIFAGGYSAGYYSYKWAEVLDADAFELFQEKGIFNTEVSRSFRDNILSRGGSEDPMDLYKKFRGREPDPNALLRREGLL